MKTPNKPSVATHHNHSGIGFKLVECGDEQRPFELHIWNKLVRQFIFEQRVRNLEHARERIDDLIENHFLSVDS